jgi:hypothetical protein
MSLPVGTKSLLFGVHQFLWHPLVVARAWRHLHGKWPTIDEWIAIIVHDWGYWGCRDMDGPCGIQHPAVGARIAHGVVFFYSRDKRRARKAEHLVLGHSSGFIRLPQARGHISKLCAPDKFSICYEPWWWYSLRAKLTGELPEYVSNGPAGLTPRQWFRWIQAKYKKAKGRNYGSAT